MIPEKNNFSKIDKFELNDISQLIDNKTINSLKPKFEDVTSNDSDLAEVRLNYNNGWDRKSNGLTPDARKKYLEADKTYHRLTNNNLTIHISKRDVYKQAELYIKYTYYGEGNPASWPGCSFHNWGLAVDMARSDDPKVVQALKEQGWSQTEEYGYWHFECTGSRDYEKVAKIIKGFRNIRTGLAYKWSEQVALYYEKRNTLNKRVPTFNRRLENNKAESQRLLAEIDTFNIDAQNLKSATNAFNKDITKYNLQYAKMEKLLADMADEANMNVKSKKNEEYDQVGQWLENELERINTETKNINKANKELNNRKVTLQQKIANFIREDGWLTTENSVLEKISKEIEQHKSNAILHLKSIDNQTWK
jgi:predicted  nucleic acid-binding Zn-ribbon protein